MTNPDGDAGRQRIAVRPLLTDSSSPWARRSQHHDTARQDGQHPAAAEPSAPHAPARRTDSHPAIASLVPSVVTLFGIGSIIGIVLGAYALNQIQ